MKAPTDSTAPKNEAKAAPPQWGLFLGVTLATAAIGGVLVALMMRTPDAPVADVDASPPVSDATTSTITSTTRDAADQALEPAPSGSALVLSVCTEGDVKPYAMCARPHWYCECRDAEAFVVYDDPAEDAGRYAVHTLDGKLDGTRCGGFLHSTKDGVYSAAPVAGRYRCQAACSDEDIAADRQMAIPGTPCVGYMGERTTPGTWRAAKAK